MFRAQQGLKGIVDGRVDAARGAREFGGQQLERSATGCVAMLETTTTCRPYTGEILMRAGVRALQPGIVFGGDGLMMGMHERTHGIEFHGVAVFGSGSIE